MAEPSDKIKGLTPVPMPENVKKAMEQITLLTQSEVPRVPEHLFVRHVLPIMTDQSGEVDVSVWLDLAGTVNRPMDVVDAAGEVLFRVPPMMSHIPTRINTSAMQAINRVVLESKLKSEQHPRMGEVALQVGLQRHQPVRRADVVTARVWNTILVRYGYQPVGDIGTALVETPTAPASDKPIFGDVDDEF